MNEERIFEALSELRVHAGVTNERLAAYNQSLDKHIKRTEVLEKEVHGLHKWRWMVLGALSVITFLAQLVIKHLLG